MSSTEDDEFSVKLDSNIEVETIVRNRYEEFEDLCYNDPFSNLLSLSSDEDQLDTSAESDQTSHDYNQVDNPASAGSDGSENYASAVSDISAESTDSTAVDDTSVNETSTSQHQRSSSLKEDPFSFETRLKHVNCKELIVFCIDMSSEMEKVPYIVSDLTHHSPLSMVKRAISMFVHHKHSIDKKHEYALMILYDTATWVTEFTKHPHQLIDSLEDLTETVECNSCDLSSIATVLTERYPFILSSMFQAADVHRIIRIILIYGRSNCMVELSDPTARDIFMDYPSIYLDIVYIHEAPAEENKCKEIYETLCSLDDREKSYIFEGTRSITNLLNIMGKLLCHPFQRVPQKDSNYKLRDIVSKERKPC